MADRVHSRPEGVTISSELPPTIHILLKKARPKNNIVVGENRAQLRFLEQQLKAKAVRVERVTDDMLAGFEGKLYHVTMKHKIDLSPELRQRTGMWAAEEIVKGSAAINTLVKHAATLLPGGEKTPPKRDIIDRVSDALTKKKIQDVRGAIWHAVWMLSGEMEAKQIWKDPWDHPTQWLPPGTNPAIRLHSLYKKLVGYATATGYNDEAAKKLGIKPSQLQHFKSISLDVNRVYESIAVLSRWRQQRTEPYICAMQISTIWS